jgi:hypothetical protein
VGGLSRSRSPGAPHAETRFRVPEQFVSLERDPYRQGDQRRRAQRDRYVDQHQGAGSDPADENPDSDDDQRSAEPDHL